MAAGLAGSNSNGGAGHLQKFCEKFDAGFIGFAFERGSGEGKFEGVAEFAGDGVLFCPGMELDGEGDGGAGGADGDHRGIGTHTDKGGGQECPRHQKTQSVQRSGPYNGVFMKAFVYVTLKRTVLDPQGKTIQGALQKMGYKGLEDVRQGKFFELTLDGGLTREQAQAEVERIAREVLTNSVIEEFRYTVEE